MGTGRFFRERAPAGAADLRAARDSRFTASKASSTWSRPSSRRSTIRRSPTKTSALATEDAYTLTRRLAMEEGLLVGISCGAALAVGLRIAAKLERRRDRDDLPGRRRKVPVRAVLGRAAGRVVCRRCELMSSALRLTDGVELAIRAHGARGVSARVLRRAAGQRRYRHRDGPALQRDRGGAAPHGSG